jgi:hypothetical protein
MNFTEHGWLLIWGISLIKLRPAANGIIEEKISIKPLLVSS